MPFWMRRWAASRGAKNGYSALILSAPLICLIAVHGPIASCDGSHCAPFHSSVTCLLSGNGQGYRLVRVDRIRTAVVLGAVLLWAATPTMACLLPGFALTLAERECCHHMAVHCGQSAMPASHACCRAPAQSEPAVLQGQANLPLRNAIVAVPATTHVLWPAVAATSLRSAGLLESPPGSPPTCSSSVLRI
jgi:hypothetical protein